MLLTSRDAESPVQLNANLNTRQPGGSLTLRDIEVKSLDGPATLSGRVFIHRCVVTEHPLVLANDFSADSTILGLLTIASTQYIAIKATEITEAERRCFEIADSLFLLYPDEVDGVHWALASAGSLPPTVPADSLLAAAEDYGATATLQWEQATEEYPGPGGLRYYVYQSSTGALTTPGEWQQHGTLLNPGGALGLSGYTITGLTPGDTYYFTVLVRGSNGVFSSYNTVQLLAATPPGAPQSFMVASKGDGEATLIWQPPQHTGGSAITGYVLYVNGAGGQPQSYTLDGNTTTYTLDDLTNGVPYTLTLFAVNAQGQSSYSAAITLQTQPGIQDITVQPLAATVQRGGSSYQFTGWVTVNPAQPPASTDVVWSMEGNTHPGTTITQDGTLTVHADETAVTLTVYAKSVHKNGAYFGTATVTVVDQTITVPGDVRVGEPFTITPSYYNTQNGAGWQYSQDYFTADFTNPAHATFTPIATTQAGAPTAIHYTSAEGFTAAVSITVLPGVITGVTATGWQGKYDGAAHRIALGNLPNGATVEYALDENGPWQTGEYTFIDEGTYTVYYRVSVPHYTPHIGFAQVSISDHDHNWSDWLVTLAPTCDTAGERQRTCNICGEPQTEQLDPLGHAWGGEQCHEPTCTTDGYTYRLCAHESGHVDITGILLATGHSWGEWKTTQEPTCTRPGEQLRECESCGDKQTQALPATGHNWGEWETVTPATDITEGLRRRVCSNGCGEQQTEPIPMLAKLQLQPGNLPNPLRVGGRFTLTPSEADGQLGSEGWAWDSGYFSASFNSPATFTALKAGETTITYTAPDGRVATLEITILEALTVAPDPAPTPTPEKDNGGGNTTPIAATGDTTGGMLLWYILIAIAGVGLLIAILLLVRRSRKR